MSNAAAIQIPSSRDSKINDIQSERSSLDSYHDNPLSRKYAIIQTLYNGKQTYSNEDQFVNYINTQSSTPEYYPNRDERLREQLKGFFTTRMECLVNDTPFHFKNSADTPVTFVYDQGSHPINYFKNAINGLFISDAIDTAPKLTNKSQKGKVFNTPDITIPGSYIGFNETIIEVVVFSDFKSFGDQVGCKVLVKANLSKDVRNFRWYNLAQKFDTKNNALRSYPDLQSVKQTLDYKKSNDKYTGFFIGNVNAKKILEDSSNVKDIIALFIVTAKVLGDFSSAISSSPRLTDNYTADPLPEMFIHASGDRLCSLEASRQGGHAIKTSPRNNDGIIPIQYIPGVNAELKINYIARFNTIHAEITKRFDDLLTDINAFSIYKYKVDGKTVGKDNEEKLRNYVEILSSKIKIAKGLVEEYIQSIDGTEQVRYETLYRQKLVLMPQAPLISTRTTEGYRKNLSVNFQIYRLPNGQKLIYNLRDDVYKIINSRVGGKSKSLSKRLRRTLRRLRGGQKPSKEEALVDFNGLIDKIREKIFEFALSPSDIKLDSESQDPLIKELFDIVKKYHGISIEKFIELVKQNRHKVEDSEKSEDSVLGEPPKNIYIEDYDEEFMEEIEEAIENHKPEEIDPEVIELIKSITEEPEDEVDMTNKDNTKKRKESSTPLSMPFTPSKRQRQSSEDEVDKKRTELSMPSTPSKKHKTYRRIRLF